MAISNLFRYQKLARSICLKVLTALVLFSIGEAAALAQSDSAAGLESEGIKSSDQSITLKLVTESEHRCQLGDGNIIDFDVRSDQNPRRKAIITIEPLLADPTAKVALSQEIPDVTKLDKLTASVSFLRADHPRVYGLFLCKDTLSTGSCKDKEIINMSKLFEQYFSMFSKSARQQLVGKPKVYFFQFLILTDSSLTVLKGDNKNNQMFEKLEEYLSSRFKGSHEVPALVSYVKNLNQNIDSIPVTVHDNTIKINLPIRDAKSCGK